MNIRRLNKELNEINNKGYIYEIKNNDLTFYTNIGKIIIKLQASYPFSPPNILVNCKFIHHNIYLSNYIRLLFKKLPNEVIELILNNLPNKTILFKKFIYDKTRNIPDKFMIWSIDKWDNFINSWSPVYRINDCIEQIIEAPKFFENTCNISHIIFQTNN